MDLPKDLELRRMVDDYEAKKQEIVICLHQLYGSILHNINKGTSLSEHITSDLMIESAIDDTLSEISGIMVNRVTVNQGVIEIDYTYDGVNDKVIHYVD